MDLDTFIGSVHGYDNTYEQESQETPAKEPLEAIDYDGEF